jgi:FMN phosphatase YigB (HAD superfamily)
MQLKYSKIIFDLDDTLVPTHANPQWKDGDYSNFYFAPAVIQILERIGRENCVLLTYDRYGDQRKKLAHLQVEKYFEKALVVDEKIKKKLELENLKNEFGNILVVGDRYDEGELFHAENLGLATVCVAFPDGTHRMSEHHHKALLVVEKNEDYSKILDIVFE